MTPEQRDIIDRAAAHLSADDRIEALWLAGSLGQGGGDQWSDVDLLACCAAGTKAAVSQDLAVSIAQIAPPLLVNSLFGGIVINVVAEGWRRFDISLAEPGDLGRYDPAVLTTLFNRSGIEPGGRFPESYRATPQSVLPIVNEFLRVLGLAPVGAGRGELMLLMAGIELLRGMTVNLMLEENGIGPWARGGMLSRDLYLTEEQKAALFALPPLAPTLESTFEGNVAIARIFLPRARALLEAIGGDWPEAFERETRAHLRATLGLEIPASGEF
ncbi:hypothetical protein FHS91_000606 [Sphingobium xanthum]|jgi:hypothetical protein|uniref:hypothetical protein n=1 Tax=Sphingobium xanthum TaxID=1387165 RepID=UPI001C8B2FD7|nr:hypothetical protein [Sphingobium xanthum]